MRVLGIDPSLAATGVALTTTPPTTHTITTRAPARATAYLIHTRRDRLTTITDAITGHALTFHPALAVIEGPSHGHTTGNHHDRSGLWWLIVTRLTELGIPILEVPPTTAKKYATGRGNASKTEVIAATVRRYPDTPIANDNEADALTLACIGARLAGAPVEASVPKASLAALANLTLPAGVHALQVDEDPYGTTPMIGATA